MSEAPATTTPAAPATFNRGFAERKEGEKKEGGDRRGGDRRGGDRGGPPRGGDRGGPPRGGPRGGRGGFEKEWVPLTKLGRLVKAGHIKSLEEIYTHSIPIKEHQIIEQFLPALEEDVMKILTVQKQTKAGQRTRFKAVVAVGDKNGHVGLGVKCAKEVQIAIRGAIISAKLSIIPVRRGYWGNKIGEPHTVPNKVTGKGGSVRVRLVPAPRGSGIVGAPTSKKLLQFAGVKDVYTQTTGSTKTIENFLKATYDALYKTYGFLSPDFWPVTGFLPTPFQKHSEFLAEDPKAGKFVESH